MLTLHITFAILLIGTGISCLYQYMKASPSTGHVVILFHVLIFIAISMFYIDIFMMLQRMAARG